MHTHKRATTYIGVFCGLFFGASFVLNAQTNPPVAKAAQPVMAMQAQANDSADSKEAAASNNINTQDCPNTFYSITLPQNGKLCQVFAAELPASMIFYVPQSPSDVVQYFKQKHAPSESPEAASIEAVNSVSFSTSKEVKSRYLLQSDDKNTTIVISSDGDGTQVDVLVKNHRV